MTSPDEQAFLEAYDPRAYDPVAVTVDVVALTIREDELFVLLVQREEPPFAGSWALPGGFLQPHGGVWEPLEVAAARSLAAETGLAAAVDAPPGALRDALGRVHLEQLGSYGAPDRDPRMRVVSVAYLAFAPDLDEPRPGERTTAAAWVPVAELGLPDAAAVRSGAAVTQDVAAGRRLAFDHARIVFDGLERARSKLEYTPLATAFVAERFTLSELRTVYEVVWGEPLHAPNFRRKVLATPGFVEPVGATTDRGGSRGGPRAELFRAGGGALLHPPLLRRASEASLR